MFKKSIFILLFSFSMCSHAYTIGQDLTVYNSTGTPLHLHMELPKGQDPKDLDIPAVGKSDRLYAENGDLSGLLGQKAFAIFSIKDDIGLVYARGRVVFYVGRLGAKYSFFDIKALPGINVDTSYVCDSSPDSRGVFQNKITLSGFPTSFDEVLPVPSIEESILCKGRKRSALTEDKYYHVTCSDNRTSIFWKEYPGRTCRAGEFGYTLGCWWWNEQEQFVVGPHDSARDLEYLDKYIKYCPDDWEL
jgi:hypothetical protein